MKIKKNDRTEKIEVIHNPSKKILGRERENLVDKLTEIARDGFGSDMGRDDVENHVLNVDMLYLMSVKGEMVGFSSYEFMAFKSKRVLYLSGVAVKIGFQKKGLFGRMNKKAIAKGGFELLVMRTQNPVIYGATEKMVKVLYPNREMMTPEDIKEVAVRIAIGKLKMQDFDRDTFVGRKTYGQSLYTTIPDYAPTKELFDRILKLDYRSGDSVMLVGVLA